MTKREKWLTLGFACALVVATVAGAAAFINRDTGTQAAQTAPSTTKTKQTAMRNEELPWLSPSANMPQAAPRQQVAGMQPQCTDGNILGTVVGGLAGGVTGSAIGKGKGKTAATIAGAMGGAYLGNQYIPLQNRTCQ